MIRVFALAVALMFVAMSPTQAQPPPESCGAKLDGTGKPLKFASPLPEDDRIGLMAAIHLTLNDSSGRGTWPISEIDIALPCEIANFPAGEDTWVISAGEGFAPPRWARAKGRAETHFLAVGPSIADARTWAANRSAPVTGLTRSTYFLVAAADEKLFVFKVYQGAPDGKQLADDMFDVITEKTAPIATYDPKGAATSLFLLTQSRRTSEIYRPDLLSGDRTATLYGPDGFFFSPAPNEAVLLRGSDLRCDDRHGAFELVRLGVLRAEDAALDLSCHYQGGESYITIFSTRSPDASNDRRTFAGALKERQDELGVSRKLQSFNAGAKEILQAGNSWVDKAKIGQGLWFMRRGEYVYEVHATFTAPETGSVFEAIKSFALSTQPEPAEQ